ncbi:cytochrome p450 [Holotrichia oblita]|uniref:Cytochrome p450 n=1 Tax=Holotrichia oblita TaxID=644536 RepID=A0ACB9TBF4_HOLOL|nr:cytochrome p450 [Holotrichia oblita]
MLTFILIAVAIFATWKLTKRYSYWTDKGVKQRRQVYILGDNAPIYFKKENFFEMMLNAYKAFPEERYMGMYQGMLPALLIRDPDLIKEITVKEFDHFLNHKPFIPEDIEPLWNKNLVVLKDTRWRDMRSTLSPSFTSSKMKIMFDLMADCAKVYVDYFTKQQDKTVINVELRDITTRYTNDVIASTAFGIRCDSINEKENQFYMMGKKTTSFTFTKTIRIFLYSIIPKLCKILNLKLFTEEVRNFFVNLIKETIHLRETKSIIRPDMINLLLEARKGGRYIDPTGNETIYTESKIKIELTDLDITAQALVFFFAGFDSVATLMSFLAYELALNPDIQQKLQEEIDKTLQQCNGDLTYEALIKMKYMDMVVTETLRKWPPAAATDRMCSKSFTINPVKPHEKPVVLNPGDVIFIPINGIHLDPQYYPNPDRFDPERFSDENKGKISPYTFLPFGTGPRNCIGSRFAILETKMIFFYILSKFSIVVTEKTQIPLVLDKNSISIQGKNGMWVGLQHRKQ